MPTVTRTPIASNTPISFGYTALTNAGGAATLNAALADSTDVTYATTSADATTARIQRTEFRMGDLALPAGAVIEWVKPVIREAHTDGSPYLTVAYVYAKDYTGFPHQTPSSTAATGANPGDGILRTTDGPVFTKAQDGVKWHNLDPENFWVMLIVGPRNNYPTGTITPPKVAKLELVVSYRSPPVVSSILPVAGTIGDTQPAVTWSTSETQEAYRVIVVRPNQPDSFGRSPGSAGYEPFDIAQPVWDSGKVYSAVQAATVGTHLENGEDFYIYVRSWSPTVNNVEMYSDWATAGEVTVANFDVASPTVTVTDDLDSYTLRVSIERVAPVGAEVAPLYFTLQRLTDDGWADVAGATQLSGAGGWQYYDALSVPGDQHSYRARGVYLTTSNKEVASPWAQVTATLADRHQWWLRDRSDQTLNRRLSVASYGKTTPKPQEVAYGAGARAATVTHQGVRAGRHRVVLRADGATALNDLASLLESGRTLVFVTAFGHVARVQVGDAIEETLVKAQPTPGELTPIRNYHTLGLELIEVEQ